MADKQPHKVASKGVSFKNALFLKVLSSHAASESLGAGLRILRSVGAPQCSLTLVTRQVHMDQDRRQKAPALSSPNRSPGERRSLASRKLHATLSEGREGSGNRTARSLASHSGKAAAGPHLGVAPATRPTAGSGRRRPAGSIPAAPRARAARRAPAARAAGSSSSRPRAPCYAGRKPTDQQSHRPSLSRAATLVPQRRLRRRRARPRPGPAQRAGRREEWPGAPRPAPRRPGAAPRLRALGVGDAGPAPRPAIAAQALPACAPNKGLQ